MRPSGSSDGNQRRGSRKKAWLSDPLKGPWLAKNDLGSPLQAPDRPTMKRMWLRLEVGLALRLLGQNQFAQACGLQAVSRAVVADGHCFLTAQNFMTVQAAEGGYGTARPGSWMRGCASGGVLVV